MSRCFSKENIKLFLTSTFAGVGFLLTFVGAYHALQPEKLSCGFWCLVFWGVLFGFVCFLIDGLLFGGFLKNKIVIDSNAFNEKIEVLFGDIFAQQGWKAIGVNEYFDSIVDDRHVSAKSLHGQMLNNCWGSNSQDWDNQIATDLKSIKPEEVSVRPKPGKGTKYEIGTTAKAVTNSQKFLCVALANTNIETLQASANSMSFQKALRCMLVKAREVCSGEDLNIPLLGSGPSKTGIKHNIIVDLIVLAIFEESKKEKITDRIRIILPEGMKIKLTNILEDWR